MTKIEKSFENFKKVARRNLPINTTYKLIDSYYTGGILENPMTCQNCGKPIANIGVVQDAKGSKFDVGMDCAATLSGINNSTEFMESMNSFNEAKAIRAKINTNMKKYPTAKLFVENTLNGDISIEVSESKDSRYYFRTYHDKEFINRYMPDLKKLILNKDKNDFKPRYNDNSDLGFDFSKIQPPRFRANDYSFKVDEYDIQIKDIQITAPNGITVNDHISMIISRNGEVLMNKTTYMPRDVKSTLVWALNEIDFGK